MYKGTHDGDIDEIKFVARFNSNKNRFTEDLSHFSSNKNVWMIRVVTKQMSQLSGKKNYSCTEIKRMIEESLELQKKIFNKIGLYEEPYTAFYFYHGDDISQLTTIPFNVTTRFGRSKGEYTIVFKLK